MTAPRTRIITVTLNPAIDHTLAIPGFRPNAVNRVVQEEQHAGGKGVNVASLLADYGLPVAVTGFLGSANTHLFEELFRRKRLEDRFTRVEGRTRVNLKIMDESMQQTTDINLPGLVPAALDVQRFEDSLSTEAPDGGWCVLSGSLPAGLRDDYYGSLVNRLRRQGFRVLVDTSGSPLRHAVQAVPTAIKPNVAELEALLQCRLTTEAAVRRAAWELVGQGIRTVIVSLGAQGAVFATADEMVIAVPPENLLVKSTVGAGDALVAGYLAAQIEGLPLTETARRATAFAAAKIEHVGAHLPDRTVLDAFCRRVAVRRCEKPQG